MKLPKFLMASLLPTLLWFAGCSATVQPPTAAPTTAQSAILTASAVEKAVATNYVAAKTAVGALASNGIITTAQGAKIDAWLDNVAHVNDEAIAATRAALAANSSTTLAPIMQALAKVIGSASPATFGITDPHSVAVYNATVATLVGFAGVIEQDFGAVPA